MENPNLLIRSVKEKIKRIVAENKALTEAREKLESENKKLALTLAERDKKIEEIQNKNINLQLSRVLGNGFAGESDLRQRLDEYIGEIDATIAHLKE